MLSINFCISVFFTPSVTTKGRDVIIKFGFELFGKEIRFSFTHILQLNTFDIEILKKINSVLPFYKDISQGSRRRSTLHFSSNIIQMGQVQLIF